ncbi:hypothetical protein VB618_05720 [Microvirga sp. CF3062]|uniref:hypothetical protein n=1 Tax=Microvirga sp. CF3062 TaxID=3110182 RepID=UPI002E78F345|nr:hypothetical protein [Microvirga sp. CF3062]MEE1655687.1 hypothetical protein [Microvirga sp. CF3062]
MSDDPKVVKFSSRRSGHTFYSAYFLECLRYSLIRHMESRERGYQTVVKLMLSKKRISRHAYPEEIVRKWRWEYVRDIVKKGVFLSDDMMRPLVNYIFEEEPNSPLHFDETAFVENVGSELADFYLLPTLRKNGYDRALLKQVSEIEGIYASSRRPKHRRELVNPFLHSLPEYGFNILSIKWAERTPFILVTYAIIETDRAGKCDSKTSAKLSVMQGIGVAATELEIHAIARTQAYHRPYFLRFYRRIPDANGKFPDVRSWSLGAALVVDWSYFPLGSPRTKAGRHTFEMFRLPESYALSIKKILDSFSWAV